METSAKLLIIDGRHLCSAIEKLCQEFPDVYDPHGWIHCRTRISVVVFKEDGYLSAHENIIAENQKNDSKKATKQDLTVMAQLQTVLNYSKTFEEEYDVTFFVSRIRDIAENLKALQYIRGEKFATTSNSS